MELPLCPFSFSLWTLPLSSFPRTLPIGKKLAQHEYWNRTAGSFLVWWSFFSFFISVSAILSHHVVFEANTNRIRNKEVGFEAIISDHSWISAFALVRIINVLHFFISAKFNWKAVNFIAQPARYCVMTLSSKKVSISLQTNILAIVVYPVLSDRV